MSDVYRGMSVGQVKEAVEMAVKAAAEKGYARSATEAAANLYESAKNKAPTAVKSTIEKVEGSAGNVVTQVTSAQNKLINDIDAGLGRIQLAIAPPDPAEYVNYVQVKAGEWKSWTTELVHFDLLSYANLVQPIRDPVQAKLAAALVEVNKARTTLEETIARRSTATQEQIAVLQTELKAKMTVALSSASELSAKGVAFVESKKGNLPPLATKYVELILASPAKLKESTTELLSKVDVDSSKKTLENVSNLLGAVKEVMFPYVVVVSDPLQARLATTVDEVGKAKATLEEAVAKRATATQEQIAALQTELNAKIKEALATAGELSTSGVAFVESKKGSLPPLAQSYVDLILASPAKLKEITTDLQSKADLDSSKKTLENVTNLMGAVKEVVYANMIPITDPLQIKLAAAVVEVNKAGASLEDAVKRRSNATQEQIASLQTELKAKISASLTTAGELSASGVAFVQSKKGNLPPLAQKSVDLILASPSKLKEITADVQAKADIDSSKRTLDNVTNLLGAVKEVVYANVVQLSGESK